MTVAERQTLQGGVQTVNGCVVVQDVHCIKSEQQMKTAYISPAKSHTLEQSCIQPQEGRFVFFVCLFCFLFPKKAMLTKLCTLRYSSAQMRSLLPSRGRAFFWLTVRHPIGPEFRFKNQELSRFLVLQTTSVECCDWVRAHMPTAGKSTWDSGCLQQSKGLFVGIPWWLRW